MATQIALGKERLWYYSLMVGLAYTILPIRALITKDPKLLYPLVPMGCTWSFQYDMFYGNLQTRALKEAERLILEEPERFFLPGNSGIIT